ncbi:MAG: bifunctional diguanylate cyclase/phosphodiesterase [Boseongicola sp.]|nr:bifunctional diguanylate cyclase/phosphodiesterase [Boseongicola sp.]
MRFKDRVGHTRVNALATRRGFWIAMASLAAFTFVAATEFRRYADSILTVQDEIRRHQTTGSQAALNEIARLNGKVLVAMQTEAISDADYAGIQSALDTLYVRADHFSRRLKSRAPDAVQLRFSQSDELTTEGRATVAAIDALVALMDEALFSADPAEAFRSVELVGAIETARKTSFRYLERTTRMKQELLILQTDKVLFLSRATLVFLGIVTFAGAVSLHMLRLEVLAREEREKAERRADRLAYFDSLTGLANRVQFQDKVDEFLEPDAEGALILIDLDGFKEINDRHGHAAGDAVLKQMARAIRAEAEAADGIAARLGGDEFAVYMPSDDTVFLNEFCLALIARCAQPLDFGGTRILSGVSIGLATTTQVSKTRNRNYDQMMRVADFALYASKAAGRGRFTIYDADLERQMDERRTLLEDLSKALENDELEVFLQPKVLMETGQVLGFEALVRWRRNGTLLNPAQFITAAEDSNRIREIDAYVLDHAIELVADWNRRHRTAFHVSVNLSGRHFVSRNSLPFVADALTRHGFAPELLTLEITETVQLSSWDIAQETVAELKSLGCRISIDDFGTGYSSLIYLRTISANELKIDKSLIDEIEESDEARFILDAVLDLAESLKLDVVVEGIEREEQRAFLHHLGCKVGRGYLFGRPLAAAEALADATYSKATYKLLAAGQ